MSRPTPTRPPPPPSLALLDAAPEPTRNEPAAPAARPRLFAFTDARTREGLREAVLRFLDEEF